MLPPEYAWLAREPGPKMLVEGLKTFGTREVMGPGNSPVIMGWARELGGDVSRGYTSDAVPWCGLWVGVIAHRAGKPLADKPLWARDWADWGEASPTPMLGDVLVFVRDGGGHVALYIGEDDAAYHVLGGNQRDQVCFARMPKARLLAARRSYAIAPPANVRRVLLAASGALSRNEA